MLYSDEYEAVFPSYLETSGWPTHGVGCRTGRHVNRRQRGTARAITEEAGVNECRTPDEKVKAIKSLQTEYGEVMMVGDKINDAPTLTTAEVGIAWVRGH